MWNSCNSKFKATKEPFKCEPLFFFIMDFFTTIHSSAVIIKNHIVAKVVCFNGILIGCTLKITGFIVCLEVLICAKYNIVKLPWSFVVRCVLNHCYVFPFGFNTGCS